VARNRITLGTDPQIRAIVRRAYPEWRGRKCYWAATETLHCYHTYWDGGTKHTYVAVTLDGTCASGRMESAPEELGGIDEHQTLAMRPGVAIVEHCFFCGKDAGVTIYVHPADAPAQLQAPAHTQEVAQ